MDNRLGDIKSKRANGLACLAVSFIARVASDLCFALLCIFITLATLASRGKIRGGAIVVFGFSLLAMCASVSLVAFTFCNLMATVKLNNALGLGDDELRAKILTPSPRHYIEGFIYLAFFLSFVTVAVLIGEGKIKGGVPLVILCVAIACLSLLAVWLVSGIIRGGGSDLRGLIALTDNQQDEAQLRNTTRDECPSTSSHPLGPLPPPSYSEAILLPDREQDELRRTVKAMQGIADALADAAGSMDASDLRELVDAQQDEARLRDTTRNKRDGTLSSGVKATQDIAGTTTDAANSMSLNAEHTQ